MVKKNQTMMVMAFTSPVIKVNGIRGKKTTEDIQEWIKVSFPENTTQEITMVTRDDEGIETTFYGTVEVRQYTKYSKGEAGSKPQIVTVDPTEKNERAFQEIISAGSGTFSVHEKIRDPQKGEREGAVIAIFKLGTKKKNNEIEFRFQNNDFYSIQGKQPPVTLSFPEQTKHELTFTLDGGEIKLKGILEVRKQTEYTKYSPLLVKLDNRSKEYLREKGGKSTLAFCVPDKRAKVHSFGRNEETNYVKTLDSHQNPMRVAGRYGTLVGVLKLKRVK